MEIEIREPNMNRYMRVLIKSVFLFVIFLGMLFVVLSITMRQTIVGIVVALLVVLLAYLYKSNRVVQVKSINDKSVILNDGKRDIELKKEEISYLSKFVRFTFTKRFLLAIRVRNSSFLTLKRYLFLNDPQNNLIDLFKNMKIDLKNIP